jgi:hypothetical protein
MTNSIGDNAGPSGFDSDQTKAPARRSSAERTRRYRERRRAGFRCIAVEIDAADVVGLIRLGHLDRLERDDPTAVQAALHRLFDSTIAGR